MVPTVTRKVGNQCHAHAVSDQFNNGLDGVQLQELLRFGAQAAQGALNQFTGVFGAIKSNERITRHHCSRAASLRLSRGEQNHGLGVQGRPYQRGTFDRRVMDHNGRIQFVIFHLRNQSIGLARYHMQIDCGMVSLEFKRGPHQMA
ncbi:hypothetical protein D3C72_1836600 [compost metagenome]